MSTERSGPSRVETVLEDSVLRVRYLPGDSDTLFLCFTGIGHNSGAVQTDEFVGSTSSNAENSVLFITDLQRSWYNAEGLVERAVEIVEDYRGRADFARTISIGNSMGGFGAILFSSFTRIDVALSFTPQFSVHPGIVPDERRWMAFRNEIRKFRYPSLENHLSPQTTFFIFHGDAPEEHRHSRLFPQARNVVHLLFPGVAHDVSLALKKSGNLRQIIAHAFNGDIERLVHLAEEQHGAVLRSAGPKLTIRPEAHP